MNTEARSSVIRVFSHMKACLADAPLALEVLDDYEQDARDGQRAVLKLRGFLQGLWAGGVLRFEDYCEADALLENIGEVEWHSHRAESDEIQARTESVRLAFGRLEDRAGAVRVCLDPEARCSDYLPTARERLAMSCRELVEQATAMARHGKG
ncbi:TPA: hypothetical protein L5T96_006201 [Pseudomonas aeruginosa]|uniref:hypothetical protein n=1 Tax=Pseudomonas aeruginosa group TaxID=136841 RepID=UPI00071C1654|nr:hypothetical protein [Pseudomonas paraeruginosa]KSC39025.1 hypothetical protein AO882_25035 [Pseudomonas paraeruginosa]HBP1103740.1 hypothetical protein [Pseudomonas aeruginosa]HBP1482851.1 hypothetical protein [Pseudomonas aeruginosa]